MTPPRFGKYEIVDSIAMGGMGEVYLARAPGLAGFEKLVALKVIRNDLVHNREFVDALVAEAKLAVRLHHTNIVQVFDLGLEGERYFLAMEYVDGLDVYRMVGRARAAGIKLPCAVAAYIAAEVAAGADYAHNRRDERGNPLGIIHRDLNPHNVLVGYGGEVKITDFGIAKVRAHAKTTAAGVIKGKLTYLSPEQARAERTDHRADVFGIGIVLYETLTGQKLYRREADISKVLARVKDADFIKPRKRRRDIPRSLEAITLQALARDPEKRYQSAEALRDALLGWLHDSDPDFNRRALEEFMRELREQPSPQQPLEPTLRKRRRAKPTLEIAEGAFEPIEDLDDDGADEVDDELGALLGVGGAADDDELDDTNPVLRPEPSAAPPIPSVPAAQPPAPGYGLQRPSISPPPATPVPSFKPIPSTGSWGPAPSPISPPSLASRPPLPPAPPAPARPVAAPAAARASIPATGDNPSVARGTGDAPPVASPRFGEISTDSETGSTSRMTPDEVLAAARWVAEMSGEHPAWLPPTSGASGDAPASEMSDRVGQQLVAVRRRRVEAAKVEAAKVEAREQQRRSLNEAAGPTYKVSSQDILALASGPNPTPASGEKALQNTPPAGSPSLSGEMAAYGAGGMTVPVELASYLTVPPRTGLSTGTRVLLALATLVLLLGAAALALILTST